jgi:NAD(P)H dehydrogenase (quinone)
LQRYELVPIVSVAQGTTSYRLRNLTSRFFLMTNPKILVTGATGKTGGAVATQLLAKGWPVRTVVHVRDARSDLLQDHGAEVVVADIFDPGQLADAMRGVQRAYYCPPYHPFVIQSAAAFADAARETGLEQIVGLSQWLAGPNHPALMTRQHWLIDRMFSALPGIAHTVINPGFFADTPYLEMMPFAAQLGVLPLPMASESRNAPPSVDDIARVAVAALADPGRHSGKSYRPTGPKLLSITEIARIISGVVGHDVRHVKSPLWMFYKGARALGMGPFLLSGLRYWFEDNDRGAFVVGAPNDTVRELTGKPAESFETIARRHAALPPSCQSFRTRLAVLARFMMLPVLPGFDPAAYERVQEHPASPAPRPAIDDAGWMASHGAERVGVPGNALRQALA